MPAFAVLIIGCRQRRNLAFRQVPVLLILVSLAVSSVQESQAQEVFEFGTIVVESVNEPTGNPLPVPAGKFNAYSLTIDWSVDMTDPHSEESIWAISDGPWGDPNSIFYVDPGRAPNAENSNTPIDLQWSGMLDLPISGPLDAQFLAHQAFHEQEKNHVARWSNTVLELSFVTPPDPPELDAELGVITRGFTPFVVDTLEADFDTELGIYSETGKLIAINDDVVRGPTEPGLPQSQVDFHLGLPVGDYFAAIGGFNTKFEDGFSVTPGVGGNYKLAISTSDAASDVFAIGSIAANEVAFIAFTVSGGDFDYDGQLTSVDIHRLITEINAPDPRSSFDLNADGSVDANDLTAWTKDFKSTWIGDANLDGEFNSGDFVDVFKTGKYEANLAASWSEGDWNGDQRFDSGDFVAAFQDGGYEQGLRPAAVATVPEPTGCFLLTTLGLVLLSRSRAS